MKTVVIGSGLIGVTTAWFLRQRGHDVTVIERGNGPGEETSFANGGLITPSMSDPWNAPGSWRVLLSSLGRSDSAMQLRLRALPGLARWGIVFLRNSDVAAYERNTRNNLRLAVYSLQAMDALRQQAPIEYDRAACGTLRIFRDAGALERAEASAKKWLAEGLRFRKLSVAEMVALEPALVPVASELAGALHYETDESGNAYSFCLRLQEQAERLGVRFHFRTELQDIELSSGRVTGLVTPQQRFVADQYVMAAGSYSAPLMQKVGIRLPVRPVKGYSISLSNSMGPGALKIPVVDDDLHAAVIPLGNIIRVAGTAEFAGYDLELREARIRNLISLLKAVLPQAHFDPAAIKAWCGLRPMCADGVPVIGSTKVPNLFVNTGHGHLGWTLAAGSARLLADLICGDSPSIDPAPFALARFG